MATSTRILANSATPTQKRKKRSYAPAIEPGSYSDYLWHLPMRIKLSILPFLLP
jgi:hypothetical protein